MITINFSKIAMFFWTGLILWLVLMLVLSSQTGTQTSELSGGIATTIANIFYKDPTSQQIYSVNLLIRKLAHIAIFLILGMLITTVFLTTFLPESINSIAILSILSVVITFGIGFLDEWRKQFVDGRHFDSTELILNFIACFIGVGLVLVVFFLIKKFR